ncbi:MAG TPA: isochorismate lyase [Crinalium sp.]|jgi:isochorismate pyruvate lyase
MLAFSPLLLVVPMASLKLPQPRDRFNFRVCHDFTLYKPMKTPEQCQSMVDIRAEIDRLDRQVVALLGQRFAYVKAASKFKTSETTVRAPERLQAMLQQRRVWAEEEGLDADVIEKMYQDLVNHFIDEEMKHWKQSEMK